MSLEKLWTNCKIYTEMYGWSYIFSKDNDNAKYFFHFDGIWRSTLDMDGKLNLFLNKDEAEKFLQKYRPEYQLGKLNTGDEFYISEKLFMLHKKYDGSCFCIVLSGQYKGHMYT